MPDNYEIKPLHMPGLADYHVHPDFSIDAVGSVNEFCEAALKRGLAEICFTTHFDSNPQSDGEANYISIKGVHKPATLDNLAYYVEAVEKAHEKYYPAGLSVLPSRSSPSFGFGGFGRFGAVELHLHFLRHNGGYFDLVGQSPHFDGYPEGLELHKVSFVQHDERLYC